MLGHPCTMSPMANRRTYEQDDLIDWSSFDEVDDRDLPPVEGSKTLRIFSTLLMLAAVACIIWGAFHLKDALSADEGNLAIVGDVLIIFMSFLTLVPGAFGLQTASGGQATPALTLGALGILLPLTSLLLSIWYGSVAYLWLILEIPALVYIVLVMKVKNGIDTHYRMARGYQSRKDELWDEDKIWGSRK